MTLQDLVPSLLQLQLQLRLVHWATKSHAVHVSTGSFYDQLDSHLDRLVESGQAPGLTLDLAIHAKSVPGLDASVLEYYRGLLLALDPAEGPALLALRDDLLADLDRFAFLMRLT